MTTTGVNYENYVGAALLVIVGTGVVIVHTLILRSNYIHKQLKVPFYALCASRSIAHLTTAISIVLSTAPAMIFGTDIFAYVINYMVLTVACLNISELFLALNRFVAVFWWQRYDRLWTKGSTWFFNLVTWVGGAVIQLYGIHLGCYLKFDKGSFLAPNSKPECYDMVVGQYIITGSIIAAIILNIVTFIKMIISLRNSRWLQNDADRRMKRNFRMFMFSFIQCLLWVSLTVIWTLQVPVLVMNRLFILGTTYVLQLCTHFMEGVVYIALNRREVFNSAPASTSRISVQQVQPVQRK